MNVWFTRMTTVQLTPDESRRVERLATVAAVAAAALAPLVAVPAAFAASARVLPIFGFSVDLPALGWRLAIGAVAALCAVVWTARHAPAMVRAGLGGHVAASEAGR